MGGWVGERAFIRSFIQFIHSPSSFTHPPTTPGPKPPHLTSSWPWVLVGSLLLTFNAGYVLLPPHLSPHPPTQSQRPAPHSNRLFLIHPPTYTNRYINGITLHNLHMMPSAHVTGMVARAANLFALGEWGHFSAYLTAYLCFIFGACMVRLFSLPPTPHPPTHPPTHPPSCLSVWYVFLPPTHPPTHPPILHVSSHPEELTSSRQERKLITHPPTHPLKES